MPNCGDGRKRWSCINDHRISRLALAPSKLRHRRPSKVRHELVGLMCAVAKRHLVMSNSLYKFSVRL